MKKLIIALALFLVPIALPALVVAQEVDPFGEICTGAAETSPTCQSTTNDPIAGEDGVIMRVVEILSWVVGVAAVIMIILGGLKFVTANGDSSAIANARNTIIYALIGIVVFLSSQIIIRFVISRI